MIWLGVAIGAFCALVLILLAIVIITTIGAASIARQALQEVHEQRRHLIDRDLMDLMDDFDLLDEEETDIDTGEEQ
jgi:uncharacterized membrane protein YhiD involved in acid resistance